MPETHPNVSISDLVHEVQGKVDETLAGIAKLEAEIKAEVERLRHPSSAAPPATESAPPIPATPTEPALPADPPAAEDPAPAEPSAPTPEGVSDAAVVPAA